MLCRARSCPLLAAAFLFANALAFVLAGGDGVDLNIYFNAFAAGVMICGVAVAEFDQDSAQPADETAALQPVGARGPGIKAAALMTALFLCVSIAFPDR